MAAEERQKVSSYMSKQISGQLSGVREQLDGKEMRTSPNLAPEYKDEKKEENNSARVVRLIPQDEDEAARERSHDRIIKGVAKLAHS